MKKLAIFALIATLFAACDIDRNPYSYYTKDQVTGDLDIMLNGCYASLKRWSDNMHYVGEFGGDNVMKQARSTDSWFQFISYMHMPTNSRMKNFWVDSYKVISQSSDLIKSFKEGQSADMDQKIGEAYYLRGMAYFYLCRTFGRPYYQSPETNLGVPIVNGLPEDMDNLSLPGRATVKETYNQVIVDLQKAELLMKAEKRQAFASKGAAQALLSRVYLYMSGTYENPNTEYANLSIQYADQVINSGTYELLNRANFSKMNEMAPDANSQTETIFAVKRVSSEFSTDDYFSCIGGMYSTIDGVGWGEVYASADIMDILYEAKDFNDARWSFIRPNYVSDNDAFRFVAKVYNDAGEHTGYTYYQGLVSEKSGAVYATIRDEEYPLTLLDEENKSYNITFNKETYHGYRGKEMV
ncbi:MAG: RagB/SusD family nutrient uptake outer membrane protein, partial [Tannerellaceae bacterium]|nr:RagB/SusD family nutrient uptake outer membrane protein [Tannerellaceae bacterium]